MIVGWPNGWPGWPNGWVFVYKLSGSGFESSCSCKFKIYDAQHENNDLNWKTNHMKCQDIYNFQEITKSSNNLTEDNTPIRICNSGHGILTIGCFIVQAWFAQVTWHLLSSYHEYELP